MRLRKKIEGGTAPHAHVSTCPDSFRFHSFTFPFYPPSFNLLPILSKVYSLLKFIWKNLFLFIWGKNFFYAN